MTSGSSLGIALSLSTAVLWAVSPMFMAGVARRIGSHATNLLRLLVAGTFFVAILLPVYLLAHGAVAAPTAWQVGWLVLSGWIGMVAGDACFYEALVLLGPRRAIKMNTIAPVVALGVGWLWQNETLGLRGLLGAGLVIAAVTYTAFTDASRKSAAASDAAATGPDPDPDNAAPRAQDTAAERLVLAYDAAQPRSAVAAGGGEPGRMSPLGLAFGIASAVCIALGALLARKAYLAPAADGSSLDPIVATVIRVGASAAVFWMLPLLTHSAARTVGLLREPGVLRRMLIGVGCGAIGGMLCYISALRHAAAGLVSTLVSTSTLIVIPLTALRYRTRIAWDVALAAAVAVAGVAMISWK